MRWIVSYFDCITVTIVGLFFFCILGAGRARWTLLFVILGISREANINYTHRIIGLPIVHGCECVGACVMLVTDVWFLYGSAISVVCALPVVVVWIRIYA